jgi:[phosphatase 2A protein]-leucine-carboxy methyltransferase
MVTNLAARGIQLQTLHRYASLRAQRDRLREHGFVSGQAAAGVDFIWEKWIGDTEKERVAELEMLDELEEWNLLAAHYCVAWGWREPTSPPPNADDSGRRAVFESWRELAGQEG